jgi:hypothetical protein
VLLLLGLLGLIPALRVRAARPATLFALLWAAYFMPHHNDHVRYLLPLAVRAAGCRRRWPPSRAGRARPR